MIITKEQLELHAKWLRQEDGGLRLSVPVGADLSLADLSWANLSRADLSGANLSWADLSWANLSRANLSRADLSWANLSRANLSGANLSGANLSGANLSRADLSGATHQIMVPVIKDIHKKVLEAISAQGCALDMSTWHSCETTHCRAGWVVMLAGEHGKILESFLGTGTTAALIYQASDPTLKQIPSFDADDVSAMENIKEMAEK